MSSLWCGERRRRKTKNGKENSWRLKQREVLAGAALSHSAEREREREAGNESDVIVKAARETHMLAARRS